MFKLETFNDLFSRPLLQEDTLIQTKRGIGGQRPTFVKAERGAGGKGGRWTSPSTDVLDIPELNIFTKEPLRAALKRSKHEYGGSSARQLQYVAFGLLLSQFGLSDVVTARDRMGRKLKENSKKIDETINWTEKLFEDLTKISKSSSVDISTVGALKDLIRLNYDSLNTYLNPSDLMRYDESWDNLINEANLKTVLTQVATREVKGAYYGLADMKPYKSGTGYYFSGMPRPKLSTSEIEDLEDKRDIDAISKKQLASDVEKGIEKQQKEKSRLAELYKKYLSQEEDDDLDEDAEEPAKKRNRHKATPEEKLARMQKRLAKFGTLSEAEKEEVNKIVGHDLPILLNFFKKASTLVDAPKNWFQLQKKLSRLNGMIYGKQVSKFGDEKIIGQEFKKLSSFGDTKLNDADPVEKLESNIIAAIKKAYHGATKPEQITNWYAQEAMKNLNKFHAYLVAKNRKTGEYPGGFTIENILKFLREDKSPVAANLRRTLASDFDIEPSDLTTEKYPTFTDFVKALYSQNKEFAFTYKNVLNPRLSKWDDEPVGGIKRGGWGDFIELRDKLESKANNMLTKIGKMGGALGRWSAIVYMQNMFDSDKVPLGAAIHYKDDSIDKSEVLMPTSGSNKLKKDISENAVILKVPAVITAGQIGLVSSNDNNVLLDFSLALKSQILDFNKSIKQYDIDKINKYLNLYWNKSEPNNVELLELRNKFVELLANPKNRDKIVTWIRRERVQAWSKKKTAQKHSIEGAGVISRAEGESIEEKIKSVIEGKAEKAREAHSEYNAALGDFYSYLNYDPEKGGSSYIPSSKEDLGFDTEEEYDPGFIEFTIPNIDHKVGLRIVRELRENYIPNYIDEYEDDSLICNCYEYKARGDNAPYQIFTTIEFSFDAGDNIDMMENPGELISNLSLDIDEILNELAEDNPGLSHIIDMPSTEILFTMCQFKNNQWTQEDYSGHVSKPYSISPLMMQSWPEADEQQAIATNNEDMTEDEDCEEVDMALDAFKYDEDGQEVKSSKQKVVFVPNNEKYKRQYLQDAWRQEAYWRNNH